MIVSLQLWRLALVGAAGLLALWVVSPASGRFAVGSIFLLAPAVAIPIGVRRYHPQRTKAWLIMALGVAAVAAASVITATRAFGALEGGLLLLVGGIAVRLIGFVRLVDGRGRVDRGVLIDIAVVVLAAGLLVWFVLIDPIWSPGRDATAAPSNLLISGLDLVLFALTIRLILSPGRRVVAFWLLVAGSGLLLVGDLGMIYLTGLGTYRQAELTDLGWDLGHVAWAVAALHPSMVELAESAPEASRPQVHRLRVIGMAGAALVAPALLFVAIAVDEHHDLLIITAAAALMFVLVILRLSGTLAGLDRSNHARDVLEVRLGADDVDLRRLEVERERLASAVQQTSDSVVIADLAGTIEYVNPAFELVSGYRRDEAVGQNPRMLKSGRHSAAFYRAMWRRLMRGQTWTGTLINRRKDGSLYEEVATISPMRSPGGEVAGYVAVKRDVTALRAAESGLARQFRERAEVAAAIARLQPVGGAEETAAEICDQLLGLPGIDVAAIVNFPDPRRAVTLALSGSDNRLAAPGRPLPAARAAYLYERATQGPWAEAWRPRLEDGRYGKTVAENGILAFAYAPIRNGDNTLGVVAAGTRDEAYARHMIEHLPAVGEFAATASALLSGSLERGRTDARIREHIRRVLAQTELSAVFQPIVDLASGEPVGYEALTRFADGTPPDRMIAEAYSVGLGIELEVACLTAALDASEALPEEHWLSLNVSADLVLDPRELPRLLADRSRQLVLEVTEHAEIEDYALVRRAVEGLGPTISLAVDDAGSGFASLRHVVELAPRFVKIDISLVRGVDRDLTRQAMIAGLRHFAGRAGCVVIAEGIEQQSELEMLRELDIPLGQGYLLGRPEAVSRTTYSRRVDSRDPGSLVST